MDPFIDDSFVVSLKSTPLIFALTELLGWAVVRVIVGAGALLQLLEANRIEMKKHTIMNFAFIHNELRQV